MLSDYLQKKVIKTQKAIQEDINMQRFVNPIVKHTYDSLPKIYGHQTKKRYLSKYKIKNTTQQSLLRAKHKCWNLSLLQEEKQREKAKLDKQKSLSRFQQNKTVKKNKQSQMIKIPTSQQKIIRHERTKSLKSCDFQYHNKLSKPKQKCNKKYCVCKTLYDEYCQQVKRVFVRNSLDSKLRKNQTYNCKKLPKLSDNSESCLDDHESRHKVSNIRASTQSIEPNGYSSGLMELIKRRQQILKQKKEQQFRQMRDQAIQTITQQQNQTTLDKQPVQIETQDKYVNTDFEDLNIQGKNLDTIDNKADAQNQTEKEEEQKQSGKLKHPKKEPMAHLCELKNKYKSKKPIANNRYCVNQHIKGKINDYYTQSQKQKQDDHFLDSDQKKKQQKKQKNNQRLQLASEQQKQYSIRSSSISEISLSKYILKGMSNQDTVFSLLRKKEQQATAKNQIQKKERKNIKLTTQKGLFTIPEEDQYIDYLKGYKPISKDFKVKNLVRSQYFKILKDNEGLFFGQYKDDQKNGKGLQITQREIFQGTFHQNIKMDGCERNIDGTYIGEFLNGKRHGIGKFLWHNGQVFEGQWKLGTKNGHGVWRSLKGDSYEGQWLMNRQHGKGIFKHKNSIYEGEFQNFLKNGSGKETFANGDKYTGQYQNGKPHGKGKYIWKNGSYYEGQFSKGLRQGNGRWHESDQISYQGEFQNDFKHGKGKQLYKNGDTYQGQFVQGIKTHGIYKSAADGKEIAIQTS